MHRYSGGIKYHSMAVDTGANHHTLAIDTDVVYIP